MGLWPGGRWGGVVVDGVVARWQVGWWPGDRYGVVARWQMGGGQVADGVVADGASLPPFTP